MDFTRVEALYRRNDMRQSLFTLQLLITLLKKPAYGNTLRGSTHILIDYESISNIVIIFHIPKKTLHRLHSRFYVISYKNASPL